MVDLGGGAVSYERGTPAGVRTAEAGSTRSTAQLCVT